MDRTYDFSGWATKSDLLCTDGITIGQGAFDDQNGTKVPMVWNHQHDDPEDVLGDIYLESRPGGMYSYGVFNDLPKAQYAKALVQSGNINGLSICANQLTRDDNNLVTHGTIREVSLVLAAANPGAFIDRVICHGEESDDELIIYSGESLELSHSDKGETVEMADKKDEKKMTPKDIFETMNEDQKTLVYGLVGIALDDDAENKGDDEMKQNVFDKDPAHTADTTITHAQEMEIIGACKNNGSTKDYMLNHAGDYGIDNIDLLFPDYHKIQNEPTLYDKDFGWATDVMANVHHVPYSRIKSMYADITADDARAKGYQKGHKKIEEVFGLMKRTTDPTTVYKKQKLDRDDVISITDFSVVAWLKREMRMKLDQELALAFLLGDGRTSMAEDKINEMNIRPIWTDDELYTIHYDCGVTNEDTAEKQAKAIIDAAVLAQDEYRGNGIPTLYLRKDLVSRCLLLKNLQGDRIYKDMNELATAMMVKKIVRCEAMTGRKREDESGSTNGILGIIVNMDDYYVGTDRGGQVSMFDDFDIDFNQMKYLIETRCSGALVNPKTAIALESVTPAA